MKVSTNKPAPGALSATSTNELRDIRPPVPVPDAWQWAWWITAAVLMVALAFLAWHTLKRKLPQRPAAPPVPPHERARQRLQEALAFMSDPREFCIRLSEALRWYLEEQFTLKAPESTTEEFLVTLQITNVLNTGQKDTLAEFLQRCDLVKFAKHTPAEPELKDLHAVAVRLVQETAYVPAQTQPSSAEVAPSQPS